MKRIATHNSVTGEKGDGILSWLVAPFSKCQSKTLAEQYAAGCRYFDIRVFKDKNGEWRCGHGLWTAEKSFTDIWIDLRSSFRDAYYSITIEKGGLDAYAAFCEQFLFSFKYERERGKLTYIAVKHPKWLKLDKFNDIPMVAKYKVLDGSSWHTYLPLPWLWKKIYYDKVEFKEGVYAMVDFL